MLRRRTAVSALVLVGAVTLGASPAPARDLASLEHLRVSEAELEQQRGGWAGRKGVEVTFGLEHLTLVDGEILQHRVMAGGEAGAAAFSGSLSGFGLAAPEMVSLVQNSLDNVRLGQMTILDIGLSGVAPLGGVPLLRLIDAARVDGLALR